MQKDLGIQWDPITNSISLSENLTANAVHPQRYFGYFFANF